MLDGNTMRLVDDLAVPVVPRYRRARSRIIWKMIVVSGLIVAISVAVYPSLPRVYVANATVELRPTDGQGATSWDQSSMHSFDDNAIQTKIDILRSDPLQMNVLEKNNLQIDPEFNSALRPSRIRQWLSQFNWIEPWIPHRPPNDEGLVKNKMLSNLVVKREHKSYVLQIGYESLDPVKAATLTNTLVDAFRKDQIGRKEHSHEEILASLGDRLKSLEDRYRQDESVENQFIISSGLIHAGEKTSIEKQIDTMSAALADAHRRSVETTNRALMMVSQKSNIDMTSDALSSPLIQHLRERWDELSSGAGSGNVPSGMSQTVLNSLEQKIAAETQRLLKAAQNDVTVALQTELNLRDEIKRLDEKLVLWRMDERHRFDLHRAVQTSLDALNGANQRYMQEAGRGDVLESDVAMVAKARVPDRPASPNPVLYGSGTLALILLCNGLLLLPTMLRGTRAAQHAR